MSVKMYGIDFISLIAPTSKERICNIAKEAAGFIYCVSSLGVTGVRSEITTDIQGMVELVKKINKIPCAVGFGISTEEQAKKDGRFLGRCDRRLGNRKALPTVQREVCALCKRICKENERISVTFDKNEV